MKHADDVTIINLKLDYEKKRITGCEGGLPA